MSLSTRRLAPHAPPRRRGPRARRGRRLQKTQTLFAEQEINSEVYWKNPNIREYVSLVPTSGISGEGIADILLLSAPARGG
jgi:translation initiation factor IF-2